MFSLLAGLLSMDWNTWLANGGKNSETLKIPILASIFKTLLHVKLPMWRVSHILTHSNSFTRKKTFKQDWSPFYSSASLHRIINSQTDSTVSENSPPDCLHTSKMKENRRCKWGRIKLGIRRSVGGQMTGFPAPLEKNQACYTPPVPASEHWVGVLLSVSADTEAWNWNGDPCAEMWFLPTDGALLSTSTTSTGWKHGAQPGTDVLCIASWDSHQGNTSGVIESLRKLHWREPTICTQDTLSQ